MFSRIIILTVLLIVASTTLGYGNSLGTATTLDNVGGDDNVTVTAADTFVTKVSFVKQGAFIKGAIVDIKNTDTIAHTYEICVISKTTVGEFSDVVGTTADCVSTGSIASSVVGSADITFDNKITHVRIQDTDISIEQTT